MTLRGQRESVVLLLYDTPVGYMRLHNVGQGREVMRSDGDV